MSKLSPIDVAKRPALVERSGIDAPRRFSDFDLTIANDPSCEVTF